MKLEVGDLVRWSAEGMKYSQNTGPTDVGLVLEIRMIGVDNHTPWYLVKFNKEPNCYWYGGNAIEKLDI